MRPLVAHVASRRAAGQRPYIGEPYPDGVARPIAEDLELAAQVAQGLSVDRWSSPRAIKRFLNAWGVRMAMANARGADLDLATMLKLYILEDRFPKDFDTLVQSPSDARGSLLDAWEGWAKSGESKKDDQGLEMPEGVSEESRVWAAASPSLSPALFIEKATSLVATVFRVMRGAEQPGTA